MTSIARAYLSWAMSIPHIRKCIEQGYDPTPAIREECLHRVMGAIKSEGHRRWGTVAGRMDMTVYDDEVLHRRWRLEDRPSPREYAFEVADAVTAACTQFMPPGLPPTKVSPLPPDAMVFVDRIQRLSSGDGNTSCTVVIVVVDLGGAAHGALGRYAIAVNADVSDAAYRDTIASQHHGRMTLGSP